MKRKRSGWLVARFLLFAALVFFKPDAAMAETCKHEIYDWYFTESGCTYVDENYHNTTYECMNCGATKVEKEEHSFEDTYEHVKIDNIYHGSIYECEDCKTTKVGGKERHSWGDGTVLKKATPVTNGKVHYDCYDCGAGQTRKVKWKYDTDYSKSYNIRTHSAIYKDTKAVKVTLYNGLKGAVLKVKLGKKTFSKKLTNAGKKVSVQVKPSGYGQKVNITLTYKGKVIGKNESDGWTRWVFYAKKIKLGMTQNQVKNLYEWGSPARTGSSSGGWVFWYYEDGSHITFRNGKVYSWYNAAG